MQGTVQQLHRQIHTCGASLSRWQLLLLLLLLLLVVVVVVMVRLFLLPLLPCRALLARTGFWCTPVALGIAAIKSPAFLRRSWPPKRKCTGR